jgi:very-short-patch-repair endonuclease
MGRGTPKGWRGRGAAHRPETMVPTRETVERAREFRRRLTPPEARLWFAIKNGKLDGLKFRRQHPVEPYFLDFYCAEARLAVEVDGQGHDHPEQIEKDARRTAFLAEHRIEVIRIVAEEVRVNLDGVLEAILEAARMRTG